MLLAFCEIVSLNKCEANSNHCRNKFFQLPKKPETAGEHNGLINGSYIFYLQRDMKYSSYHTLFNAIY